MIPEELTGLRRIYLGFTGARVVLTANNLGVFERLRKISSAAEVAQALKADLRGMEILLDALAGLGLLHKTRGGRYRNSPACARYLVKGGRLYQGDIIRHAASMWESFSRLDEVILTGSPVGRGRRDAAKHEAFIMGMHNLSVLRAGSLIRAVGTSGVDTMLDLGGGPGTNAIAMSKKGVKAAIFDFPQTIAIARKVCRAEGATGIRFIEGDFHTDSIGAGYDLILISQIFHAYSEAENVALLEKCREALNRGGRVIVQEFPIDESRTSPAASALFSVNMLVNTPRGRCYTPREMKKWLKETGFNDIKVKDLPETVLVEGRIN